MTINVPKILSKRITNKYNIVKNTFILKDKKELHNEFEIEIGDLNQNYFHPQLKIKRWDNECNFSVRLIDDEPDIPKIETEDNKIKFIKNKIEAHFYDDKLQQDGKETDAYEFEIILKEKPATNKIQMSIETKGLRFYYQPSFKEEHKIGERGAVEITDTDVKNKDGKVIFHRPENVVGSYAVYHESKKNHIRGQKNYQGGKAFPIYKPKITDAEGNWAWEKLNIDVKTGILTITIPQEFLDNAVYPINSKGLTFGCDPENPGSGMAFTDTDALFGTMHNSPVDIGVASSISIYCWTFGTSNAKGVIALYSDLKIISDGVGAAAAVNGPSWITSSFSPKPTLAKSTEYLLAVVADSAFILYYDSGGVTGIVDYSNNYIDPTDPTDGNPYSDLLAIYCTYESAPSLPTVTTQAATDVTHNSATGNGNITDNGGENCDKRGIVYSKTNRGDPGDTSPADSDYEDFEEETDGFGTGAFTRSLTGLDVSTKYYARAYAHNSEGYSYGAEIEFDTLLASKSQGIII